MKKLFLLVFLLQSTFLFSNQDEASDPFSLDFKGYLEDFRQFSVDPETEQSALENRLANRLELGIFFSDWGSLVLNARNLLFWGQGVDDSPSLASLSRLNQSLDFNWTVFEYPYLAYHLDIDRIYFDLGLGNFFFRIGKQRINWSLASVWNPLDWFNTINYFDLSYLEGRGANALLLKYYLNSLSYIDLVVEYSETFTDLQTALSLRFNVAGYDLQFQAGKLGQSYAGGLGWSGDLFKGGFKGEVSYFYNNSDDLSLVEADPQRNLILASIGYDYSFQFPLTLQSEFLYLSDPMPSTSVAAFTSNERLTINNLSANHFSLFFGALYDITPLVQYIPNLLLGFTNSAFREINLRQGFTFSILSNLDLALNYNLNVNYLPQANFFGVSSNSPVVNHAFFSSLKFSF